jgi:hypothetical protein
MLPSGFSMSPVCTEILSTLHYKQSHKAITEYFHSDMHFHKLFGAKKCAYPVMMRIIKRHAEFPKLLVMHRFPLHKHSHKNDTKTMNKPDCHKVQGSLIHSSWFNQATAQQQMFTNTADSLNLHQTGKTNPPLNQDRPHHTDWTGQIERFIQYRKTRLSHSEQQIQSS